MTTQKRRGGMTLLEVLISIAILAVGVAGMGAVQVLAMRDEALARESHEASRVARDALEQVQRMPWASVATTGGAYATADFLDYAGHDPGEVPVQVREADGDTVAQNVYAVNWRVAGVLGQSSLRTVDVQVVWTDELQRQRTYTASTIKYNPKN